MCRLEEVQRSPEGGGKEPHGFCFRAASGDSVRGHGSLPAETAAVVLRLQHADRGLPGSVRYGAVGRREGRCRSDAALAVLRSVSVQTLPQGHCESRLLGVRKDQ